MILQQLVRMALATGLVFSLSSCGGIASGDSGLFGKVLPEVAQDPAADLFFINIPVAGAGYDVQAFARDAAAFACAICRAGPGRADGGFQACRNPQSGQCAG